MSWTRRRAILAVVALALVAAAVAGGYVLGAANVADRHDAVAQRRAAYRTAFDSARSAAARAALDRGARAGRSVGVHEGRAAGARRGGAAGAAAVRAAAQASRPAVKRSTVAKRRAESEVDIGGIGSGGSLAGGGGVLVVGDSLEVLTSPYLKRYLPSTPLKVNAVGGYSSLQIFDLFKQSYDPSQSVIVFDAGTNDNPSYSQILAGRLKAVADAVGNRCMVVPTIHGLSVGGVNSDGKNRVVRAFAASRPGTQTPDWAGFVATHPELMQSDDLHPIPAGAELRARLIAQGVRRCLQL